MYKPDMSAYDQLAQAVDRLRSKGIPHYPVYRVSLWGDNDFIVYNDDPDLEDWHDMSKRFDERKKYKNG